MRSRPELVCALSVVLWSSMVRGEVSAPDATAGGGTSQAGGDGTATSTESEGGAGVVSSTEESEGDGGASPEEVSGVSGGGEEEPVALPMEAERPLTPEQRRMLVPAPGELTDREQTGHTRLLLPPYMEERGRGHHTRVFFPLYFESRYRGEYRLLIPPYYRLRTSSVQGDVVFPFYFRFRGEQGGGRWATDVIPPGWLHTRRGPEQAHATAFGLAPLFSYAEVFDRQGRLEHEHLVIPPLLTFHRWWPTGQTTIVGPVVYLRDRGTVDWAVVPFVVSHTSPELSWRVIPPLLYYQRVAHHDERTFTLVGPYFSDVGPGVASYNFAPLFFHWHDRTSHRTTVVPLFHTESGPSRFMLVTPLGGYVRHDGESTLVLPFYQHHRGVTDWDAVMPLFYYSRTPRLGQRTLIAGPVFWSSSPSGSGWGVFPFVARFQEYGRYDTLVTPLFARVIVPPERRSVTWVFPTVHAESAPDYRFFNVYPLLFTARGRDWHHNVFFPLVWDVGNRATGSQITVVAPFYVRVADRNSSTRWIFPNFVSWDSVREGQRSFGWDLFPLVQYGEPRPGDMYWSVLHGLVGYRRQGSYQQYRLFWIPFGTSGPAVLSARDVRRGGGTTDTLMEL